MSLTTSYRSHSNADNLPVASYPLRDTPVLAVQGVPQEPTQLGDYFKLLAGHWKMIGMAAVAGCILGVLLSLAQTPSYRTKTAIEIQNINGDFLNMKEVHPVSEDIQGSDAIMDLQTQIEVLQSTSLAEAAKQALKQAGLKREWAVHPAPLFGFLKGRDSRLTDKVLDGVADSIKVHMISQTRIIVIQVDAPNPSLAADFANTLIAEYIHQNIRARAQMTEAAEDWTRSQLVDMRRKLESSEQALQEYAARYGLVFTSAGQTVSDERLRQVQSDLLHARTDLVDKRARRNLAEGAKADSLADFEKDTDLRDLRSKLTDLRRQEAELLTIYKPTYSEVLKVKAQADEVEHALTQARQRVVGRAMDEFQESSQKEHMLSAEYNDALAKASNESQTAVQYDILKHEADANLSAYQSMLAKVKDLGLAAAFRTSNVRVVDPAEVPEKQRTPQLPLNILLGIVSGLSIAIGYVFVTENRNTTLRHPGEAALKLGIPELAAIPTLMAGFSDQMALPPPNPASEEDGGLAVIQDESLDGDTANTDAFRTLLASLMFAGTGTDQPQVVVVTSTAAQDGKTTVCGNLAIALARAGKRVLLIDGDLRRPSLHQRFSLPNMIGLGNLLQAGCDATDAQFAVLKTSITRLSVLPSGSFTAAPADLLFQPNLNSLLNSYREHFDMIVVDSPPLMGLPDARLLSRAADGVVLVARANKTSRSALATACQRLSLDRSRVLGLVLNDWRGQESPYPAQS